MDETLVAKAEIVALDPRTKRARLRVWEELDRAGERVQPIKNSEAEVQLS
jgi:predicted RecB family endonuclease